MRLKTRMLAKHMDGIAGIVYPDAYQITQLITPMLETLKHRGSQSQNIYTFKNIQIGSSGDHFFSNIKKTTHCTVDANINNTPELQQALKQAGCNYPSFSVPELLTQAYECWGNDFINRVNGDFAIAILDQEKERILLFRDRIGKKPLYWYQDQHHFIFSSELKALLATGAVAKTPALDAISSYLHFGYIPQDMSPIKNVNKLLPAHYLQYENDGSVRVLPYWSYSSYFTHKLVTNETSCADHLDQLLKESVQSRLPHNDPVGCFVSGGLGSASIAHYVSSLQPKEHVSAFSVGFSGQNDDDLNAAKIVSASLGIKQESEMLTPKNFLNDLIQIIWYLDEPLADPNVTATWKMAELAKQKVSVAFSGMGSDELLAGHSRYTTKEHIRTTNYLEQVLQTPLFVLKMLVLPIFKFITQKTPYHLIKSSRTGLWQFDYLRQNALFDDSTLPLLSPTLSKLFDPEIFLHKFRHMDLIESKVSSCLYFDVKTRLPDCFMLQYERLTAAHGLEWMAPYLDKTVLEYLAMILTPDHLEENDTASILKIILKKYFPEDFVDRPKLTRKNFLNEWVEESDLKEVFPMLRKGILVESGLLSASWLHVHTATPEMRMLNFQKLWSILILEIWFRLFIQNPIGKEPPTISVKELLL